jgi:hypothetical protein
VADRRRRSNLAQAALKRTPVSPPQNSSLSHGAKLRPGVGAHHMDRGSFGRSPVGGSGKILPGRGRVVPASGDRRPPISLAFSDLPGPDFRPRPQLKSCVACRSAFQARKSSWIRESVRCSPFPPNRFPFEPWLFSFLSSRFSGRSGITPQAREVTVAIADVTWRTCLICFQEITCVRSSVRKPAKAST